MCNNRATIHDEDEAKHKEMSLTNHVPSHFFRQRDGDSTNNHLQIRRL